MAGLTHDPVHHPPHYTQGRVECIEVLEQLNLDFRLTNVVKYIWRHREKGGLEDLRKAKWYLDRYLDKANPNPHKETP